SCGNDGSFWQLLPRPSCRHRKTKRRIESRGIPRIFCQPQSAVRHLRGREMRIPYQESAMSKLPVGLAMLVLALATVDVHACGGKNFRNGVYETGNQQVATTVAPPPDEVTQWLGTIAFGGVAVVVAGFTAFASARHSALRKKAMTGYAGRTSNVAGSS